MELIVRGDEFIAELVAWRLVPGPYARRESQLTGLIHLAALPRRVRRALVRTAFSEIALSPGEARGWLLVPGAEAGARGLGVVGSIAPGGEIPLLPRAGGLSQLLRDPSLRDSRPDPWPLLPVELALLSRTGEQRALVADLMNARLDSRSRPQPAPGMAGSVLALGEMLVGMPRADPGQRARTISSALMGLKLNTGMARACLLLGGAEAIRLDPRGVGLRLGALVSQGGTAPMPIMDPSLDPKLAFRVRSVRPDFTVESAWPAEQEPAWVELQTPAPPDPAQRKLNRPRWRLPVELARRLGHGPDGPRGSA